MILLTCFQRRLLQISCMWKRANSLQSLSLKTLELSLFCMLFVLHVYSQTIYKSCNFINRDFPFLFKHVSKLSAAKSVLCRKYIQPVKPLINLFLWTMSFLFANVPFKSLVLTHLHPTIFENKIVQVD